MTTSCCPAYVNCVKKNIPELEEYISHTKSPMVYASRLAKEELGNDIITVFVGPCSAKRDEAIKDPWTDLCLTYDEIVGLFDAFEIDLVKCEKSPFTGVEGAKEGRGFSVTGGLAATVLSFGTPLIKEAAEKGVKIEAKPYVINGLTAAQVKNLKKYAREGKAPGNIIEVMVCEGGCVSGPGMPLHPPVASTKVKLLCNKTKHHEKGTESVAVPYIAPK
jgi:iron only hydrogenase large subunit-like protein